MDISTSTISQSISTLLQQSTHPLAIAHIRPDGDAIGSLIGLGLALQAAGKQCQLVLTDGIPAKFKFLEGSDLISHKANPGYDLVIALDCSDQKRMGKKFANLEVDINVDHHITNDRFAKNNLVLANEAATSAILAQYLPEWGFPLNTAISNALLIGMLTDTIGFRTSNVTPQFLKLSAHLMEKGADLSALYEKAITSQSFSASLLWGFALSRLQKKDGIAWTSITLEDRKLAGYPGKDDADLTNQLSSIENISVSILFNEQINRKIKVSWRSDSNFNVSTIASRFGGGGHPPASGAEIIGTLKEVEEMVLTVTRQFLENPKSKGENNNG
jgi:bifunctional oligoribonuclease and PAP phosphatase NrnA